MTTSTARGSAVGKKAPDKNKKHTGDGHEPGLDRHEVEFLLRGRHHDPHSVLGRHGSIVRAFRPGASEMYLLVTGPGPERPVLERVQMRQVDQGGLWEGDLDRSAAGYRIEVVYGATGAPGFVFDDPYRLWPTLGDLDLHLFNEGRHRRLWEVLGAHPRTHEGVVGVAFAVWAPNAKAVRVVGDWNFWDGRLHPMRALGNSGVWELFIPGAQPGARYKYEIISAAERLILKADPFAFATEVPPGTASVIAGPRLISGETGPGWKDGQRATFSPSRCRYTRFTWALGAGRTTAREGAGRYRTWSWRSNFLSTSPKWALRTWSSCL